jgi:hypothetical protein
MLRFSLLALLVCLPLFAQTDATVLGTVRDSTSSVVPNAKVTLLSVRTGNQQSMITDANGYFEFPYVRLGDYTLRAEAAGFKAAVAEQFTVTVNARQRVDLILEIGQVTEDITVTGAAAILETDSSNRSQVINSQEIVNLPLNGRSYADLTLLVPGVRKSMLENQTLSSREASYNVNGQRAESNNFVLDGVDNNAYGTSNQGFSNQVVQIAPDAVAEYRVETNNYSAEYGHASAAIINASTRSGSNQLHGSAWEFLRNTSLNAVGFFQPPGGVKPVYQQNQFGASAGFAILRDKLFFFGDYEGQRRNTRTLTTATVPTADQRAGRLGVPVVNPITGAVYSDGVIPDSVKMKAAQNILNAMPLPNVAGNSNNLVTLPKGTLDDNKGDFRLDYYASPKLTAFTRYSHRVADIFVPGNIPGPAGGNDNGNVHIFNQQVVPGLTYTLTPTLVLEARAGIGWTEGGKTPLGLGEPNLLTDIPNLPTSPIVAGAMNSQSVQGFSQFGRQSSNPQFQNPFVVNPKVSISKLLSRHTLKAGWEFLDLFTTIDDFNPAYGNFNYTGQFSKPAGGSTSAAAQQAYGMADFFIGAPSHYELNNLAIVDYRQYMHFFYLQDDWKATDRLTLNLGVRYEFASPQWVADNRLANFDPKSASLVQAKPGSLEDRSLQKPDYKDWAPRLGFAWRPFSKTVFRGGYGLSYQQFNRLGGENLLAYNGPNIIDAQIDQLPSQGICASPAAPPLSCFRPTYFGYPQDFAVPANFKTATSQARYIPYGNPTGYVQSWHFTVQRELARDLVLDVAYVANKGTHLMILADANQAAVQQAGATLTLAQRRPYPNFGFIEIAYGAGYSNYNALQVKVEKRYSHGLYLLNAFTWSKAIDNASGHLETANGDNSRVNYADLRSEKGLSSYDQPFNDTTSIVWALPVGTNQKLLGNASPVVNGILGGWQFTAINTLTSGLPINLTYSVDALYTVSTAPTYRPNISGNPVTPEGQRTVNNYLDKSVVSIPTGDGIHTYPWGNAGRNIARGYAFYQLDIGLQKRFPLWSESRRLEFRAEAFNLFNQTNFQAPNSSVSSTGYGSITSTFPARQLQFAMKLMF